jgi:hypothetical protein
MESNGFRAVLSMSYLVIMQFEISSALYVMEKWEAEGSSR